MVHSMIELGGTITSKDGSEAMWATMVNTGTGVRLVGQSLEMHSTDTSKTPFFDTLSTASFGYGGNPFDVSLLKVSQRPVVRFRRKVQAQSQLFDYNLLAIRS